MSDASHGRPANSSDTTSAYTGTRAEQLISGATRIVTSRSRRSGITRAAITAGIAHAWALSKGTKARPGSPTRCIRRSITKAARAM